MSSSNSNCGKRFPLGLKTSAQTVCGSPWGIAQENATVRPARCWIVLAVQGAGGRPEVDDSLPGPTDPFDDRRNDRPRCQSAVAGNHDRRLAGDGWCGVLPVLWQPGRLHHENTHLFLGQVLSRRANAIAIPRYVGLRSLIATLPTPSA